MIDDKIFEEIKDLKPHFFKKAFPKIFSWEELEALLNLRPMVNDKRFVMTDCTTTYGWRSQGYLTDINSIPPSLLDNEILQKYVCYLADCSRVNPQTNLIASKIEKTFPNSVTDAHIYFSVGDILSEGFGIHMDYLHVLVIHVEGSSRIRIWDPSVTEEMGGKRIRANELEQTPIIDEVLETGDAAFIPINTYHCITSQTKRLSISFPIQMYTNETPQDRHWIKLKV